MDVKRFFDQKCDRNDWIFWWKKIVENFSKKNENVSKNQFQKQNETSILKPDLHGTTTISITTLGITTPSIKMKNTIPTLSILTLNAALLCCEACLLLLFCYSDRCYIKDLDLRKMKSFRGLVSHEKRDHIQNF